MALLARQTDIADSAATGALMRATRAGSIDAAYIPPTHRDTQGGRYVSTVTPGTTADVLMSLASSGPASRTELAQLHAVSLPTLSRTVQALADAGLVEETRTEAEGRGRPLTLVSLVTGAGLLMGVKLTDDRAWIVVADPAGSLFAQESRPLQGKQPDAVAHLIARAAADLRQHIGRPIDRIGISLGASVVGGRIVRVAPFLGWKDVPFADLVSTYSGLPTHLANDVRAFAYTEAWYGQGRLADPFVLLTVGAGLGCGVILGGTALAGAHGSAGSIGHLPITDRGPACEYGHPGCARALASTSGMLAQAQQVYDRAMSFDELVTKDQAGDEAARAIFDTAAHALGTIAGAIVAVVDPSLIVISGEAAEAFIPHQGRIAHAINQAKHWAAPAPTLRIRPFSFTDWARGAAAIAVEPWAVSIQQSLR